MSHETDLAKKMHARAEADGLAPDHALRLRADEFDEAAVGYYAQPQTSSVKQFIGAWARARSAWSSYSGEPLI